ncbi:MAG TPA: ATP synthase F1 subunit epsilon [Candidatus Nealsonbacteria bacterium]|uniref:ATP synthase F1 complex delta/epsilon subunit N-terminal domain-containing protein n=1 Tax=marine sediment metagenome TaxID=412755 RepID=A0A0F9VSE7_9ZZZZ|nr:ATP synthase F1 subunit epsilon [Candidatus Nealsonbacteria bacterium]HEB46545.1 ATP synthase F1 subunit epsilon [Candidatus Nealsonbacteria bacterium]
MFPLFIIALDKVLFEGKTNSVTLPGSEGELTILKNHIPLITPLKKGNIKLKTKKEELNFRINGGVLEVKPEKVVVLTIP